MADINQKNYSNRFVNPYNFFHFPEKMAMAYGETDRHTGVIIIQLRQKRLCLFRIQVRRLLLRSQMIPQITNVMIFFPIQNLTEKNGMKGKRIIMYRLYLEAK